jgi:hypothetical protein
VDKLFENISEFTLSKIRRVNNIDEINIPSLQKALIAVHSSWSSYSVLNGKSLLTDVATFKSLDFEIILIDIDSINLVMQQELFGQHCQGYFESVWVEQGKVIYTYFDNSKTTELSKFKNFISNKTS